MGETTAALAEIIRRPVRSATDAGLRCYNHVRLLCILVLGDYMVLRRHRGSHFWRHRSTVLFGSDINKTKFLRPRPKLLITRPGPRLRPRPKWKSAQRRRKHPGCSKADPQTNEHTNIHTNRQRRLQYTAQLSAQCNNKIKTKTKGCKQRHLVDLTFNWVNATVDLHSSEGPSTE